MDITATDALSQRISDAALRIEDKVIAWRRDIHEKPELSYQEMRTAQLAAEHLKKLGYEVKTGVGITGVVGVLKGGKPGGVVALRADMDALLVEERVDLPFASKAKAQYLGQTVPVMHACGHDCHVRPDERGRDPGRHEGRHPGHGEAPVPAQRGRLQRRPPERRAP